MIAQHEAEGGMLGTPPIKIQEPAAENAKTWVAGGMKSLRHRKKSFFGTTEEAAEKVRSKYLRG